MNDFSSQDVPTADRRGWELPRAQVAPEQIEVAPGTLSLLGDAAFAAPLVPAILDAYLRDRGHDPSRKWRLRLLGAVIVADEGSSAAPPGTGTGPA